MAEPEAPAAQPRWLVLAHFVRPQGRKGELLADLLTDFPERFSGRPRVFVVPPDYNGSPEEAVAMEVTSSWLPSGRNSGRIVLGLSGSTTISEAEALKGQDVAVPIEEKMPLDEGAVYIHELTGADLFSLGARVGRIEDVLSNETPADTEGASILVVRGPAGEEILVPFAIAYHPNFDSGSRRLHMELPEGLIELYQEQAGRAAPAAPASTKEKGESSPTGPKTR